VKFLSETDRFDGPGCPNNLPPMTATSLLGLKQQLTKLTESERRHVSAFLIRLGGKMPHGRKKQHGGW
jgi:hypothetical protein